MKRMLTLCLSGALLTLPGCAKRETAVEAGINTQTLHVGNSAEPPDLDPNTNNSLVEGFILQALFEGLVRLANDGTTILPGVAERWEISPDGRTYTFHLRDNAQWSNGELVTADDFLASFRRYLDPKLGCEAVNNAFPIVGARDYVEGRNKDFASVGVKAPDPRTVEIRLRFRAPYFLTSLTNSQFMPPHQPSLDRFGGRLQRGGKWTQPGNLISNGPFILKEWQPNVVLVVARNPRYWDAARVHLNEIRFYPTEDIGAEERAFRAGQLHVTYTLPYSKLESYTRQRAPEPSSYPILNTHYVTFSTQRPPFNDARVRRAFSLVIDRDRLATSVLKGRGDPAFSYVRPGTGGYFFPPFSRFDPAEAQRLLRAAGFPDGRGFPTVEYTLASRDEANLTLGQALQQMWQQHLGVKVSLTPTEFRVWLDILRNKSFAFTSDNWNMGINDPSEMLAMGVTGDPNNDAGWSHARYNAAFAAVENAPDDPARRSAIENCERILAEEVPYAPVYFAIRTQLVHPAVRGWRGNPMQQIDWTALSLAAPE